MTDLHLHTTASDGRSSAGELVDQAAAAGLRAMAVTDHDTTASIADVQRLARTRGIEVVPGIEVTAVEDGRDVHVLGYFIVPGDARLEEFLVHQRIMRVERVKAIGGKLADLGLPVDVASLIAPSTSDPKRSIGRPQVARAMIAAGHVQDVQEAFDLWLGNGRPAYMERTGASPETVVSVIHAAGGLASLAHPGRTKIDGRIREIRDAGLDAIEVYHPDHDAATVGRYEGVARDLDLLVTGGSDYHGDPSRGVMPGSVTLPAAAWQRLRAARSRHARAE